MLLRIQGKMYISLYCVKHLAINGNSVDGLLGIRSQDHRMVGENEST